VIFFGLVVASRTEPLTIRDSRGQVTGFGDRRGNTTTFSNALGQRTGRATTGRDGVTTIYDANGRQIGSRSDD
jgi:YD repeat-containing protein